MSTGQTTIQGTLDSIASTTYVVRFSSNPGGTDLEGKKFLGKKSVTTKRVMIQTPPARGH